MANGVQYDKALIRSLEKNLASAFQQPYLRLTRRPEKRRLGGTFVITLESGTRIARADNGSDESVMAINTPEGPSGSFYFSFVAKFALTSSAYFAQHTSLTVFQDICGELSSLFRAEWDNLAATDAASEHAQPHWHFAQSPARIETLVRVLQSPVEFNPTQPSGLFGGLPDCGRFHFAMVSLWDKNLPLHKKVFESGDFLKWFEALTKHVAHQIDYLEKHVPSPKSFTIGESESAI